MKPILRKIWWYIVNRAFPWPQPHSREDIERDRARRAKEKAECEERIAALPDDENAVAGPLAECSKLLDEEEARRLSVDGRLTSILGLCSIAATIVFGGILALAAGTLRLQATWMRYLMAFGALYLTTQLCAALLAAVRGLSRKGYLAATATDILPSSGERRPVLLRRRIDECLNMFWDHQEINNQKVTEMAVAHRAMKNFLWALLLIAALGAVYGAVARYEDPLVERVKKDRELQELLRGPQGLQGPPGPTSAPAVKPPPPSAGKRQGGRR